MATRGRQVSGEFFGKNSNATNQIIYIKQPIYNTSEGIILKLVQIGNCYIVHKIESNQDSCFLLMYTYAIQPENCTMCIWLEREWI